MSWTAFAPAKVNLFLHVGPLQPDGYHPIGSLAVFANVGDRITATPSERFETAVTGPFAEGVPSGPENLVARAVAALEAEPPKLRLTIDKRLPVAAGLGGGSGDAAAALRLLVRLGHTGTSEAEAAARTIGADGLACLRAESAIMEGRGDRLSTAPRLATLHAVLVNPRAVCPTGAVYKTYDSGAAKSAAVPATPASFADSGALAAWLAAHTRNDLEPPAERVQPAVTEVLAWLRARPGPLLVRMSGSGATAFALMPDEGAARALAAAVESEHSGWWARACRLGGEGSGNNPPPMPV